MITGCRSLGQRPRPVRCMMVPHDGPRALYRISLHSCMLLFTYCKKHQSQFHCTRLGLLRHPSPQPDTMALVQQRVVPTAGAARSSRSRVVVPAIRAESGKVKVGINGRLQSLANLMASLRDVSPRRKQCVTPRRLWPHWPSGHALNPAPP